MTREEFIREEERLADDIYERSLVTQDVRYQIEQYKEAVNQAVTYVKDLKIVTRNDVEKALTIACEAINLGEKIEETKKSILEPTRRFQAEVNSLAKDFIDRLEEVKGGVVDKIDGWKKTSPENTALETGQIMACEKEGFAFDVTDLDKVPREFLTVDEAMIRQAAKSGRRVIPGINITQTKKTYLRRKVV